ncbi:ABC transporter ATP-binding protein [Sulfurisoma sediminicola]|uniref:Amino acid/amide ABC transporter ATP-binding protein 1 (HAAT family) n=1 Tax=Sulfurisoma sediminicola TaxID=1381557 RepID=A0A497XQ53_9PROT|nr:ABC transporter ATP-binding protein [Sulfurisoma sediminicola]RLJ68468.1 amino acid/amide ABC transporter ATP-binding protein 1 (HAAT family) [Sulfurisoma sediminicola]
MAEHAQAPLLQLAGLVRHFGGVYALNGVDLSVERGEIHALIGPNGAGKTTLIHHISGAMHPDAGSVRFDGADITRMAMHTRVAHGLARSYQITNVFARLTVFDNIALAVEARHGGGDETQAVIERIGLAGATGVAAGALSHGEQRQLEVGLALATAPRLLLLDEPLAGMGPEESERMIELLDHLGRDMTLLLVEHDMDAVFRLADRVSVLVAGKVIASGLPDDVRADAEVRRAYLGDT